ncbi:MAG: efflux RND transporter periplasmic adaptor subunit [Desulfovibrio sp.]|jgi:HlyD family secretion protein|nr:efflux RND transporter periplasmic adaptor subunit [Desulfovibrio sp.]
MKKKLIPLFLVILVGAACFFYFRADRQDSAERHGPIVIYGNVDIRDVALGFRVSGRILEVRYEEGDRVRAGDVVAVLDKQPFTDDVALYRAQLEEAVVTRNKVEKPFLRRAELTKIGAISTEERDDAEAARDEAQAQVKSAEARLQKALTSLQDTEILAPNDGAILTRVREPGAVVAAGEPVYSLALNNPVWIRTYVPEPLLGHIYPGQAARVATDSGHEYEGRIGFISPQAEFTPKTVETAQLRTDLVYRLRIIVNCPDQGLRQGMPVTISIARGDPGPGVRAPEARQAAPAAGTAAGGSAPVRQQDGRSAE